MYSNSDLCTQILLSDEAVAMKKNKDKNYFLSNLLKFFLCIFILLIVLITAILIWQRENVASFVKATTSSTEDIAEEIADSKAKTNDALAEYETPVIRDFTLEEEEMIRKGELSAEDALSLILDGTLSDGSDSADGADAGLGDTEVSDPLSQSQGGSGNISDSKSDKVVNADKLVGDAVKRMYSLKAYYIGRLGSLESEMKSEYISLPADKRGKSAISSILSSHMGEVSALEAECDSRIAALLSELESDLGSIGADTSIVSTLKSEYQNEKSLRKSYYVSSYLG